MGLKNIVNQIGGGGEGPVVPPLKTPQKVGIVYPLSRGIYTSECLRVV